MVIMMISFVVGGLATKYTVVSRHILGTLYILSLTQRTVDTLMIKYPLLGLTHSDNAPIPVW